MLASNAAVPVDQQVAHASKPVKPSPRNIIHHALDVDLPNHNQINRLITPRSKLFRRKLLGHMCEPHNICI